jgi:hypothetical protein
MIAHHDPLSMIFALAFCALASVVAIKIRRRLMRSRRLVSAPATARATTPAVPLAEILPQPLIGLRIFRARLGRADNN